MTSNPDIAEARDGTFQRIGRNVTIFQKMEGMLKFILIFADFSTSASEIVQNLARQVARHQSKPMGHLVSLVATALHKEPTAPPEDVDVIHFSTSFGIEGGKAAASGWRKEMERVVTERNNLIHKMLASFDPNSQKSCELLSAELDAQQDRVTRAYRHLESLVQAIRAGQQALAASADKIAEEAMTAEASRDA